MNLNLMLLDHNRGKIVSRAIKQTKFPFKIGDKVVIKGEDCWHYNVVSENPKDFWLQNSVHNNVYLRFDPNGFEKVN